jgi:hypothetical protein
MRLSDRLKAERDFVEKELDGRIICGQCKATLQTYSELCTADSVLHGLFELIHPAEPCGADCECADYHDREGFARGIVTCYRKTPLLEGVAETESLRGKCTCAIGLMPCQIHGWNLQND